MTLKLLRIATFLMSCLLITLVVYLGVSLGKTHAEYQAYKKREQQRQVELAAVRERVIEKREYLNLLVQDNDFLERVVRERLGYARTDERIFRFPDSWDEDDKNSEVRALAPDTQPLQNVN